MPRGSAMIQRTRRHCCCTRISCMIIRRLFRCYGVRLDGVINGARHLREVQGTRKEILPQKLPNRYHISLHIDDEPVICSCAGHYGFRAYQLNEQDDDWKEKIIDQADKIRKMEHFEQP